MIIAGWGPAAGKMLGPEMRKVCLWKTKRGETEGGKNGRIGSLGATGGAKHGLLVASF